MSDASLRHEPERRQREKLEAIIDNTPFPPFEQFRAFPVFTPRYTLARFLTHYELFKKIVDLPGTIVDLGVYRGSSTFTWAKLCEIFCPTDIRKSVFGFDTFEGFPDLHPLDGGEDAQQDRRVGGYHGGEGLLNLLQDAQEAMNEDRHLRHIDRIKFIAGNATETMPKFVSEYGSGLKVALLNLDADLYEPTRVALESFMPHMVSGGLIIADEYAVDTFSGETQAIDDFFIEKTGKKPVVKKFTWHSNPSAFIEIV